jgi:hypothetical protein
MTGGEISQKSLPDDILNFKRQVIQSIPVEYLGKVNGGYLLTFGIHYKNAKSLVVSTLDSKYTLMDYRIFTNGLGSKEVKSDTIAIPVYNDNGITVEIMHPNEFEEPDFRVDGIRKEELVIGHDLKIINAR